MAVVRVATADNHLRREFLHSFSDIGHRPIDMQPIRLGTASNTGVTGDQRRSTCALNDRHQCFSKFLKRALRLCILRHDDRGHVTTAQGFCQRGFLRFGINIVVQDQN
ncbi:hypothetical protein D3C80_1901990 [compost metagenome]